MSRTDTDLEMLLRTAMNAHTERLAAPQGLARRALHRAQRVQRAQRAVTAAAAVATLGTTGAVGVIVQHRSGDGTARSGVSLAAPSTSCFNTNSARPTPTLTGKSSVVAGVGASLASRSVASASASHASLRQVSITPSLSPSAMATLGSGGSPVFDNGPAGPESAAIAAVTLPDPAPGFPLRRGSDGVYPTGFGPGATFWTATFLLGVTPPDVSTPTPGVVTGTPTGAEASVLVIDGQPFDLSAPNRIEGVPVVGTTQVQGRTAIVTKSCDQTDLYFSSGRFQVLIAGFPGSTTVETLVTLGNAIHGLQ